MSIVSISRWGANCRCSIAGRRIDGWKQRAVVGAITVYWVLFDLGWLVGWEVLGLLHCDVRADANLPSESFGRQMGVKCGKHSIMEHARTGLK